MRELDSVENMRGGFDPVAISLRVVDFIDFLCGIHFIEDTCSIFDFLDTV